ncbi:hypothetical protein FPZ42_02730 [Mucilaginibacter achroorhodeus]|uniref:Uncharacterized protein n=1 Tax=Mucilaginibacter achroorhodeus TaxID=2599294 RepID=A0A563UA07_9SPHI|nr:hypothetical protein [Mucilaginibacter achroorhodeus]TWR28146.1 hypothetical protein FPZ42_02730 [Mucilaginibacter achroorhodeus]
MKKLFFLVVSVCVAGMASAQKAPANSADNFFNQQLSKNLKADSTFLKKFPQLKMDSQNNLGNLNKMYAEIPQNKTLPLRANTNYGPAVKVIPFYSKMPVVKLKGNSKMPVMGAAPQPKNNRDSVVVIP